MDFVCWCTCCQYRMIDIDSFFFSQPSSKQSDENVANSLMNYLTQVAQSLNNKTNCCQILNRMNSNDEVTKNQYVYINIT